MQYTKLRQYSVHNEQIFKKEKRIIKHMKIYLTRHGETLENKSGIIQGHLPGQLSTLGKEQAQRLALRLKNETFDAIYTSDLARAYDTAQAIAIYHQNTPFIATTYLRERCWGSHEGKTHTEIMAGALGNSRPHAKGAETETELHTRVRDFLRELRAKHKEDTILLVGHGGSNRALLHTITGEEPKKILQEYGGTTHFSNAGLSILDVNDKGYSIRILDCTEHMKQFTEQRD